MFVSLYDADRVHYLLREFCRDQNLTLQYHGCVTQSENRPGVQHELATGATHWSIKGTARREVVCRLIAADRAKSNDAWRLKIGKSELAMGLPDPDRYDVGRETKISDELTIGKFLDEFCPFAEGRMKAYRYGVPALPRE